MDTEFEWRKNPQDCRKLDRQTLWVEIVRRLGRYDVFEEDDRVIKIRDGHLEACYTHLEKIEKL